MKLTLGTTLVQVLLALPFVATTAILPIEERVPTDNQVNSTIVTNPEERGIGCVLHAIWDSNWADGGYWRYRVRGTAEQGPNFGVSNTEMLKRWCGEFLNSASAYSFAGNPQCNVVEGNLAFADVSSFVGQNGHNIYVAINQDAVNAWRFWTNFQCDVDSSF